MWRKLFAFHLHTMLRKKSFFFAVLITMAITGIFLFQIMIPMIGYDRNVIPSAWYLWNTNAIIDYTGTNLGMNYSLWTGLFGLLLMPFLAPLAYADSAYDQMKSSALPEIMIRSSRGAYYSMGALVTFLGAFLICLIPYVAEQIILAVLCAGAPLQNVGGMTPLRDNWGYLSDVLGIFWGFQANHPYLYNLLLSCVQAALGGSFAVLVYALSLYFHRNRFLVLTLPGIFLWIVFEYIGEYFFSTLQPPGIVAQIGPGSSYNMVGCFFYFVIFLAAGILLLFGKCKKARDVLA